MNPAIKITSTTESNPKPGIYSGLPVVGSTKIHSLKLSASSTEENAQNIKKKAAPKGKTTNKPFIKYLNNALKILFIMFNYS